MIRWAITTHDVTTRSLQTPSDRPKTFVLRRLQSSNFSEVQPTFHTYHWQPTWQKAVHSISRGHRCQADKVQGPMSTSECCMQRCMDARELSTAYRISDTQAWRTLNPSLLTAKTQSNGHGVTVVRIREHTNGGQHPVEPNEPSHWATLRLFEAGVALVA